MKDTIMPIKKNAKHPLNNLKNNPDSADKILNLKKIEHFHLKGTLLTVFLGFMLKTPKYTTLLS